MTRPVAEALEAALELSDERKADTKFFLLITASQPHPAPLLPQSESPQDIGSTQVLYPSLSSLLIGFI